MKRECGGEGFEYLFIYLLYQWVTEAILGFLSWYPTQYPIQNQNTPSNAAFAPPPSFLYSPPSSPHPRGTPPYTRMVPSAPYTYYSGATVRYF